MRIGGSGQPWATKQAAAPGFVPGVTTGAGYLIRL